jgi:protein gp37
MGDKTKIEWCDHTFNPWIGCQRVSPGCDHCYAEPIAYRMGVGWGPGMQRRMASEAYWLSPHRWARRARQTGIRPKVFCASMADVFDNQAPDEWRTRLWQVIRETSELDWLILTKRPENIERMLPPDWGPGWCDVWLGISAEDQERFNHRWPILQKVPAMIRFVSYEPALGPLDLIGTEGLHWLICGGESGRDYRPMDPMWEGWIREQCRIQGISYFFKQLAGKKAIPKDFPLVRQFPMVPVVGMQPSAAALAEDDTQFDMFNTQGGA